MSDGYRYITLLSSLPHLRQPFHWERPPISRIQLESRLDLLTATDRRQVARIQTLIQPYSAATVMDDATLLHQAERLLDELESRCLCRWIVWRLQLDVLTAALRRRHHGETTPGPLARLPVVGRQLDRYWAHPTFTLERRYPYLTTLVPLIEQGDSLATEQALLTLCWHYFSQQRAEAPYGFEDVVLYLFRWWLVERSCQRDESQARQRFTLLLETFAGPESLLKAVL
ncbi:hypothetical protein ACUN9V_00545 [Salinicola sp. V024]|uniref:hypothetical protein n=1 Tax=Salinicola sp. V024 TaxID=3459609 RepID=UPI004043BFED